MKRMKKIIVFLLLICSILSFSGCLDVWGAIFHQCPTPPPYDDPSDYPEYPDYQSAYTEEEHIERISEIVAAQEWTWMYGARMAAYEVETVYAFSDNDPEFFLIDLKFQDTFETLSITNERIETDEGFMLGYIVDDEYYIVVEGNGDNPWEYVGYADLKKYFGSYVYAVEIGGLMMEIARDDYPDEDTLRCEISSCKTKEMSQTEQIAAMDYKYLKEVFKRDTEYDTYTTWRCEYREHENLNRLSLLTENGAWKNEEYIPSSLGNFVDFEVETVYAFYDYTPQFFLIDLTFENTVELTSAQGVTETTNQAYILGRIDEYGYYYTLMISSGRNPWEVAGYGKEQKYYGQFHYAVERDGRMTAFLYQSRFSVKPKFIDKVLTVEEEKDFLECKYSSETIGEYKAPKTE